MGPSDWVGVAEEGARQQRRKRRAVYSVIAPVRAYYSNTDQESGAILGELSELICRVEQCGWTLGQVSPISHSYGSSSPNHVSALLIFRAADE